MNAAPTQGVLQALGSSGCTASSLPMVDGRYRIIRRLGSGAWPTCTAPRPAARPPGRVKLLNRASPRTPSRRALRREAQRPGLHHPNVVGIFDRGDGTGPLHRDGVLPAQLSSGRDHGALEPALAVDLFRQILKAARLRTGAIVHATSIRTTLAYEGRRRSPTRVARAGTSDMPRPARSWDLSYLSPSRPGPSVDAPRPYRSGSSLELLPGSCRSTRAPVTIALKHVSGACAADAAQSRGVAALAGRSALSRKIPTALPGFDAFSGARVGDGGELRRDVDASRPGRAARGGASPHWTDRAVLLAWRRWRSRLAALSRPQLRPKTLSAIARDAAQVLQNRGFESTW